MNGSGFQSLKIALIFSTIFIGLFLFTNVFGATIFEDFNSYTANVDLLGQGSWTGTPDTCWVVDDVNCFEGKCAETHTSNSQIYKDFASSTDGTRVIYLRLKNYSQYKLVFRYSGIGAHSGNLADFYHEENVFSMETHIGEKTILATTTADVWFKLTCEYQGLDHFAEAERQVRCKVNNNTFSAWKQIYSPADNFTRVYFQSYYVGDRFDYFASEEYTPPPPPAFRVYGISPVSGTEITSTSTDFTFGWEGLDPEIYEGFTLNFREKNTGIVVKQKIFFTSSIYGATTTPLINFEFDKNSDYYLESAGILVSDYYRVEAYNDLVSPDYFLTINFEGLSPVFEMTDFETWYGVNSKFATPTAIFTSITGFLSPVFSKLGEFGARTTDFFDIADAYTRGYNLGLIFPTFSQYVDEIEVFMGGFPIVKLFLIALIVLLGIFAIKLIMKFIPFFG
jgi:hypothetical protein